MTAKRKVARPRLSAKEERRRMSAYKKHASDTGAAAALGITSSAVRLWRKQRGLPAKRKPGGNRPRSLVCKNGHRWTLETTYTYRRRRNGKWIEARGCIPCMRKNGKAHFRRKKGINPEDKRDLRGTGLRRKAALPPTFACGHERTEENTYWRTVQYKSGPSKAWSCRTCHHERYNTVDRQLARTARDIKKAIQEADWEVTQKQLREMRRRGQTAVQTHKGGT